MQPVPPFALANLSEELSTQNTRFDDLLLRYRAFIRRVIVRTCPSELKSSHDDIEQEAWISLWKTLRHEREIVHATSYIHTVAVSAALRAIRRLKTQLEVPLVDEGDAEGSSVRLPPSSICPPDKETEKRELRGKIESALAQLPANRRRAVKLHLQGLTTQEIGDLLGWTEAKARNLLYRGLKDLKKSLRAIGIAYQQ